MYRLIIATIILLTIFQLAGAQDRNARKAKPAAVNVTGSYVLRNSTTENALDAQKLSDGKVKIYLYASWIGNAATGNVNNGELKTTLPLVNNRAVYKSGECTISIKFTGNRAIVTQTGSSIPCDFGLNVSATGTYAKRSSRAPKFDF